MPHAVVVERFNTLQRMYAVARAASRAEGTIESAQERVEATKGVLDHAGDGGESLRADAQTLLEHLSALADALEEANPGGRLGSAVEGIVDRPTEDQMWQLERGEQETISVIDELNALLGNELVELEAAVYLPGARPLPIEPVPLPQAYVLTSSR
jgi:hypothetical protein